MTVYNQRIKFSIILGVLFVSIVCVIWYNNNISSRLNYVEKRITYLDDQIIKYSSSKNAYNHYSKEKHMNNVDLITYKGGHKIGLKY